jgi:hypothetical protein
MYASECVCVCVSVKRVGKTEAVKTRSAKNTFRLETEMLLWA